jgi:hypothetical protein
MRRPILTDCGASYRSALKAENEQLEHRQTMTQEDLEAEQAVSAELRRKLANEQAGKGELEVALAAEDALVVGYPTRDLPAVRLPWAPGEIAVGQLRGAEAEAGAVAARLGTTALIGPAATKAAVAKRLGAAAAKQAKDALKAEKARKWQAKAAAAPMPDSTGR